MAQKKCALPHERSDMSVLEKIVQAEKDARDLLLKTNETANDILLSAHEELNALKAKNLADQTLQINTITQKANNEITTISGAFDVQKDEITQKIALSAKTQKDKIVNEIFKDITNP